MRVSLNINTQDTDVMGDEPIWPRTGDSDTRCVSLPHNVNAAYVDASGKTCANISAQRDDDWRTKGWVTTGGHGRSAQVPLVRSYLPASLISTKPLPDLEVEILDQQYTARYLASAPLDPDGSRIRN